MLPSFAMLGFGDGKQWAGRIFLLLDSPDLVFRLTNRTSIV